EYAKHDGDASVHLRELQAAGGFRADVIVMRGFAAQDATDSDKRIIAAGCRKLLAGQRQFERARNMDHVHILIFCTAAFQGVERALQEALGDEAVEAAHDDAEAEARSV